VIYCIHMRTAIAVHHFKNKTYSSSESEFTGGRFMERVATLVSSFTLVTTNEEDELDKRHL